MRSTPFVVALAAAIRFGPGSLSAFSVPGRVHPEPVNVLRQNEPSLRRGGYSKGTIPNSVILPPVTGAPPRGPRRGGPEPLQVGFNREIPAGSAQLLDPAALIWSSVNGGRVTAVSVTSPGAVASASRDGLHEVAGRGGSQVFRSGFQSEGVWSHHDGPDSCAHDTGAGR